jgi:hypothetical protein
VLAILPTGRRDRKDTARQRGGAQQLFRGLANKMVDEASFGLPSKYGDEALASNPRKEKP